MKPTIALIAFMLLLMPAPSRAQKVKIDEGAAEIIAENTAAAVAVEKLRTLQVDSAKQHKQKVAEALVKINVFKESLKKAKQDYAFFKLESSYCRKILDNAASILATIPKFVQVATTYSPQASVQAIRVGTEISSEVAAIINTYKMVCINTSADQEATGEGGGGNTGGNEPGGEDPGTVDDGGLELKPGNDGRINPDDEGGGSQGGSDTGGTGGNGGSDSGIGWPTVDDGGLELKPGNGGRINPDDEGGGSQGGSDTGKPSVGGGTSQVVPTISLARRRISEKPDTIAGDIVEEGGGLINPGNIGDQVEHTRPRNGDGFNWLDRSARLGVAINLSTRLATIRFKMESFIKAARFYKPVDIIRMIDPTTWGYYLASRNITESILYNIENFNLDIGN